MKIVLTLAVTLLLIACSEQKSEEAHQAQEEISKSIDKISKVVKEESVNITKSVEKVTKEVSQKVLKETKKVAQKTVVSIDKALEKTTPEVLKPKKISEKYKKDIKEKITIDGGALFSKCSSCHGVNADKKALNKSQSIKGWSVAKLVAAINGYKDGTYGGSMKGVMKPQVNKLSSDEVQALSEYISKL